MLQLTFNPGLNLNVPFTELRRTGQEAAKTELFEARASRHHARQHSGPAGRNLTDLNLPVLRAYYVCNENSQTERNKLQYFEALWSTCP